VRIFFSTGEASGDMYAAHLLREIKRVNSSPMRVQAIGGRLLKSAGAEMVADSSRWGAMGIVQSLKVVPRAMKGFLRAKKAMRLADSGLFVPVDFGFMNVRLARYAREYGWKVLYFMPPGSWRRTMQGEGLAEVTDEVVTPFSWSSGMLHSVGVHAHWYGHPLKQILAEHTAPWEGEQSKTIAILPGSRLHEVQRNLKVIARAGEFINKGLAFEFAIAPSYDRNKLVELWHQYSRSDRKVIFTEDDTIGVLKRARAGIICSGTATLEAALCRCPMVVIYKFSLAMELEARALRIKPEFISLPNIICHRKVVPELIQRKAKPKTIALELLQLVEPGAFRDGQLNSFHQIDNDLGGSDAITRTASLALKLLSG